MKKISTIFFISVFAFLFLSKADAQPFKVGLFTGFGMSSFETFTLNGASLTESAGTFPLGLQAYYSIDQFKFGSLNFGLEFNYGVVPFSYEVQNNQGQKINDTKYSQMAIAALVKVKFLKKSIRPYARLGAGLYSGNFKQEWTDAVKQAYQQQTGQTIPDKTEFDSGFGFNIGAGADYVLDTKGKSALFFEFVFHIVTRTTKGGNPPTDISIGLNNWAVQVGYQIGLGN